MKISEIISRSEKPFPSLEIVPPVKGVTRNELIESIKPFMEFNPPYVNVTYHKDGCRVSQSATCAVISDELGVEAVPHLVCAGNTKDSIISQLHDFKFLGFQNILALRGDGSNSTDSFRYAKDLVNIIKEFNGTNDYDFCIGAAGYPEKHVEAPDLDTDIAHLKAKVDAGASYIITQMFFDNEIFYNFRDKCRAAGIKVPIIPALKPISTVKQLDMIRNMFSVGIPKDIVKEISACGDDADKAYDAGLEWCITQGQDLLKHGVPAIHFFTMGRAQNIYETLKRLF